jgi:hypothetical protein
MASACFMTRPFPLLCTAKLVHFAPQSQGSEGGRRQSRIS